MAAELRGQEALHLGSTSSPAMFSYLNMTKPAQYAEPIKYEYEMDFMCLWDLKGNKCQWADGLQNTILVLQTY